MKAFLKFSSPRLRIAEHLETTREEMLLSDKRCRFKRPMQHFSNH
jgi:hypothetical protein